MPLIDRPNDDYARKAYENRHYVRLYDPPVDGVTPADGEGLPRNSLILMHERDGKLAQGFTTDVQGWPEDAWPTLGDDIYPDIDPYQRRNHVMAERAAVTAKASRTREIKR